MNDLPDDLIMEAVHRRRHPLVRIAALAACLALLLVSFHPFLKGLGGTGQDGYTTDDSLQIITHNGALYEIWRDGEHFVSNRLNLPKRITNAMVGEACGSVDFSGCAGTIHYYQPLYGKTGAGPAALYILKNADDGDYQWLIFTGLAPIGDANDYGEASALFPVYAIHSADDIASIKTLDGEEIDPILFYDALMTHDVTNFSGWYDQLYGEADSEEAYLALEKQYLAGSRELRLESREGLVCYLSYYPAVDYVKWLESYIHISQDLLP